jgi:hypothetical protein
MKSLLLLLLSSSVIGNKYYICTSSGEDKYTVEINLESKKLAFFDYNWSFLSLYSTSSGYYVFKGLTYSHWPIKVDFDENKNLVDIIETQSAHSLRRLATRNCRAVSKQELTALNK